MPENYEIGLSENLITLLCHDDVNGKIIANLANPNSFEGDYRIIAERAIRFWRMYGKAPKQHIADELSDILDDPHNRRAPLFRDTLNKMLQNIEEAEPKYILDKLREHEDAYRTSAAIMRAAELYQAKKHHSVEEIRALWHDVLNARAISFDPGMRGTEWERVVKHLQQHTIEFQTGIPLLDKRSFVPMRGSVMMFLAPTGRGKSWFLVNIGKRAWQQRKKVLHVTLELSEEETWLRYYQAIQSASKREAVAKITQVERDRFGRITGLGESEITSEYVMANNPMLSTELEVRISHYGTRYDNIRVKKFPMRSLTIPALRGYMESLELIEKFIPDILILDYIGVMQTDPKNHRITLGRVGEEFKGLCEHFNVAGVTAQQSSRIGVKALNLSITHIAEDWSLTNSADQILLQSNTNTEFRMGLARLYVAKARTEEDHFGMLITQNFKTGQYVLDCMPLTNEYYTVLDKVDGKEEEAEEEDDEE